MENFKLHWKGNDNEKGETALNLFKERKEKGIEKYPEELEKTEEEKKVIAIADDLIQKEIRGLDFEPRESIVSDRVHFLSKENYKNIIGIPGGGIYSPTKDAIVINKDFYKDRRLGLYTAILHELVHYYSFRALDFSDFKDRPEKFVLQRRVGYMSSNNDDSFISMGAHEHFRGLTEVATEKIVSDILEKNREFLIKEFNISKEEIEKDNKFVFYKQDASVIDIAVEKWAENLKKNPNENGSLKNIKDSTELWKIIKKNLFTGDMMYLRSFEDTFGPGSLRVLAALSSYGASKKYEPDVHSEFELFFKEPNQQEREKIANRILSERERLNYKRNSVIE